MRKLLLVLAVAGVLSVAGIAAVRYFFRETGETTQQVLDRFKPRYDAKRKQLVELANQVSTLGHDHREFRTGQVGSGTSICLRCSLLQQH